MTAIMTEDEAQAALAEIAEVIGDKLTNDECLVIARLLESSNNRADRAEAKVGELESQLEQVSTGRAISMTLQIKSKNVAESIADLRKRMEGMGCFIADSDFCPDEVFEVIHDWLADQFETVPTPGVPS